MESWGRVRACLTRKGGKDLKEEAGQPHADLGRACGGARMVGVEGEWGVVKVSGQRGAGPGPGAGGQFRSCEGWGGQAGGFAVVWGGVGLQLSEVIRVLREAAGLKVCMKERGNGKMGSRCRGQEEPRQPCTSDWEARREGWQHSRGPAAPARPGTAIGGGPVS